MFGLFKMIGEVAGFAKTLSSSEQRRERYELLLDKKAKKALEAAETLIHGMDSFLAETITLKQFKRIFKVHRRRFFDND